jgi:Holliday junction DNA helicase RuvB
VGLETLAAGLGEDPATLEAVVEPFLLQLGFLQRTPRGRLLTAAGRAHLEQAP